MKIINIENLTYKYGEVYALENVNLEVNKGDFIGIIGPNGGGKTTLIKVILKLLKPSMGKVEVDKSVVFGYVPQVTTFEKTFPISVMDVILTGHLPKKIRLNHKFSKHEEEHALSVMQQLKVSELADKKISDLSLGQLQKVLIARALMNHPNVLILDEPTASIDIASSTEIYAMIKELSSKITIMMITHDVTRDLTFFDKLVYVHKSIHVHGGGNDNAEKDSCPIDWLRQGELVHKKMH